MPTLTEYQTLLLDYEPRPIRGESAYRKALRDIEKLMRPNLPRAESELVELLATLIEQYESREHPVPKSPPREMLAHLMEARGVVQATVAAATGIPRSTISAVLAGRRKLSTANIAALSNYFHVSASAFMETISDPAWGSSSPLPDIRQTALPWLVSGQLETGNVPQRPGRAARRGKKP